jgi:uncharacterized protein DUF4124
MMGCLGARVAARCALALIFAWAAQNALAMNKCADENGHIIYTDAPCPDGSKKKELPKSLQSVDSGGEPAAVVAQADAALAAGDIDKFDALHTRATQGKNAGRKKKMDADAKAEMALAKAFLQVLMPNNIRLIDVTYPSPGVAVVREEGIGPSGGKERVPQINVSRLIKESGEWKIQEYDWKPK